MSLSLVHVTGGAPAADQGGRLLVLHRQPRRVGRRVDGGQRGGGQPRPRHRPGVNPARGCGGLVGQRQDLAHHVHVVSNQQRYLQDLWLRRLEEEFLRLRCLLAGDDEHEVVLAAPEGDDVGVGEPLGDLHGVVVEDGHALLVDCQPHLAAVQLILHLEESCSEELPLPGAGQEDPHTVRGRLPRQGSPLLGQGGLHLLPLLWPEGLLVTARVELVESLHNRGLVWSRASTSSLEVSEVDLEMILISSN